jgi:hypothetical protein
MRSHLLLQTSLLLLAGSTAEAKAAIKVCPLGDSITLGVGGDELVSDASCKHHRTFLRATTTKRLSCPSQNHGYRDPLGSLLAGSGVAWDFVGPHWQNGNHAGYNGWTMKQLNDVAATEGGNTRSSNGSYLANNPLAPLPTRH